MVSWIPGWTYRGLMPRWASRLEVRRGVGVGEKKKTFWIRIKPNQIKGGSNPPCGFSLPISGLSFISGPWWGCHVDRPTSYYDNGSRGSTCSGGYCLLGDVRKTGGMCTKTKIEGVIDTRKASVEGEVKLESVGLEVWARVRSRRRARVTYCATQDSVH